MAGSRLPPEATFLVCQKVTLSIFYSTFQSHDPDPLIKPLEIKEDDEFDQQNVGCVFYELLNMKHLT